MENSDLPTILTALVALPLNGVLLLIVIALWRRTRELTDEVIECHKAIAEQRLIRANATLPE